MDTLVGYRKIIASLDQSLDQCSKSIDGIKVDARMIFTASSLIFALASFLQYNMLKFAAPWGDILKVALVLLYVALVALCIFINTPQKFYGPTSPEWEVLKAAYLDKSEEDILLQQISGTLNAISLNKPIVRRYSRLVNLASFLLALLILVMLISPFVPLL